MGSPEIGIAHFQKKDENINIWGFKLSDEDMREIAKLDIGHSEIINHFTAETAKFLNGFKIHD